MLITERALERALFANRVIFPGRVILAGQKLTSHSNAYPKSRLFYLDTPWGLTPALSLLITTDIVTVSVGREK